MLHCGNGKCAAEGYTEVAPTATVSATVLAKR
jgi:hypothetical protein